MEKLTKRERIQAALAGEAVDRLPVGFWRHFPGDDQDENTLAMVALDFQNHYDLDFIKFPVSSTYSVADYGVKHEYRGSPGGDRVYTERVIKQLSDWDRIEPLNVQEGVYGWHLKSLAQVICQKEEDTPVVVTVFNPVAMLFYLAGDELALVHLRQDPKRVERALEAVTQTCANFCREAISAGADGIFLSARAASYELMNAEEYRRFGRPSDLAVLDAAQEGWFNILHLHGQHPMFGEVVDYPVAAINWHDRTTSLSLAEASHLFKGALMGGVEQYKVLHFGSPTEVQAQVHDAINHMNGRRLIVTPGCTYPLTVPHANLMAMRAAVGD